MFSPHNRYASTDTVSSFLRSVYSFMAVALVVTGTLAYLVAASPNLLRMVYQFQFPLLLLQLGLVFGLSLLLPRLSFITALVLFFSYAALTGVLFSGLFIIYTQSSIMQAFFAAAGMFGVMAVYGYVTRTDLTKVGNIALMILLGMIIAGLVNLFVQSSAFDLVLAFLGVIIFSLLTAYDMQKLTAIARGSLHLEQEETINKLAVYGALALYLDFLNIFLSLLRLMGRRRD